MIISTSTNFIPAHHNISLSLQIEELFGCASVGLALITIISILTKPASVLFPPVPVRHGRFWFTLCLTHHALQFFVRFPLRLSHRIGRPVHRQTRQFSAG